MWATDTVLYTDYRPEHTAGSVEHILGSGTGTLDACAEHGDSVLGEVLLNVEIDTKDSDG